MLSINIWKVYIAERNPNAYVETQETKRVYGSNFLDILISDRDPLALLHQIDFEK